MMVLKRLIKFVFVPLFSMAMSLTYYYIPFSFICNYYIARRLRVCFCLYQNSKVLLTQEKHLPNHLRMEFFMCVFIICTSCFSYFLPGLLIDETYLDIVQVNVQAFVITFLIWNGFFLLKKTSESEISYLSSVNNLTLGYGVAIWYYKNYLYKMLSEHFLMSVRQYTSKENVKLPHKLYILYPKSCKVRKYIDDLDCIFLAKELPPYTIDHGGVAGRKYCVSVYRIEYNGEFFRCALEYAQPLKTLLALKENGRISLSEMYIESESFIKNLTLMLKDHRNSFEDCELVEYDDETEDLPKILSDLPSVQAFKCKIVA